MKLLFVEDVIQGNIHDRVRDGFENEFTTKATMELL